MVKQFAFALRSRNKPCLRVAKRSLDKDVMRQAVRKMRTPSSGYECGYSVPSRIRDQQRVRGLARGESGVVEKVSLRSLSYFVSVLGD